MIVIDTVLYLEINDAVECGLGSAKYLYEQKSRGAKWVNFEKHPVYKNLVLIEFESLKPTKKKMVTDHFGNPYDYFAKKPIRDMVVRDGKAESFFLSYSYDGSKKLPTHSKNNIVEKYTVAASWLNMLIKAQDDFKAFKKALNISAAKFWLTVGGMIQDENIALPTNQIRLREKIKEYMEKGYEVLIHKQFGNDRAKKVKTEEAEAVLLNLMDKETQPDDVLTCKFYNHWAVANNLPEISPATVGNYRRDNLATVTTGREGRSAYNEKFIRQVKGKRPSIPLSLVEHDDNNLDFLFQTKEDNKVRKYVAIVVTDSFNDLVLGYSHIISQKPMPEMVYEAYINAMYYIRHLTGGWYMPFEFKADKYASSELNPYYQTLGKFIPPAHGNKHRGYIEQFFRSNVWKRSQQLISEGNWSGNNISAKYRGVNQDFLKDQQDKNLLPFIGEGSDQQINNFFHLCRHMPDFTRENMNAPSKEAKWLEAWNQLTDEQKKPITDEQFLLTFGIKHQPQGRKITINNRGIEPQISNNKYSYDLPETWMYNDYIGEEVSIYFDPYDMSRVLVTNEKDIRFIAKSATLVPRALQDHFTGSRTFLNSILTEKKDQVGQAAKKTERRKELAAASSAHDPEAVLQIGMLKKEVKNNAEHRFLNMPTNNGEHEQYLNDNYDLNQFFNQ